MRIGGEGLYKHELLLKYTPWFYRNNSSIEQYRYTAAHNEQREGASKKSYMLLICY
jgi:hypothetical protein